MKNPSRLLASAVFLASGSLALPACIVIDDLPELNGDEDFSLFADDDLNLVPVEESHIAGDIGPAKDIDCVGTADDFYNDDGSLNGIVHGVDNDGEDVMSMIDIYGLDLEPGAHADDVIVSGCANPDEEGLYDYDDITDDATADVVACDDPELVDVIVTATIRGEEDGEVSRHQTTVRLRRSR